MVDTRRYVTEIHRRSLWQVVAVYGAAGWFVLQVVDVLSGHGILPGWVFKAALVLLLVGLPVVVATAIVQEGVGGRRGADGGDAPGADDDDAPGAGGATGAAAPATRPLSADSRAPAARRRLLTWRNVIIAGTGAFAALGFASAGYMGMRALGIGAPGTLLAQGVLVRGATVVVSDFDGGADPETGAVVTRALVIDLLQSPTIRVLDRADLGEPLARMHAADVARITPGVAAELAEREGYAAVITGEVAPLGTGYVLTASILAGDGFERLAGFRETARDDAALIDAVERLSRAIRDKVGESLRSIRSGPPLAQVTTASLPALRAYTRGTGAEAVGDLRTALEEFERAVALDSTFAMAHRKISAVLGNIGVRPAEMRRAARRAWELSDRLPERERHLAAGFYHLQISGEAESAIRAFEQALRIDSTNAAVRNNLAVAYRFVGRYADAAQQYVEARRNHANWTLWYNLAFDRYLMGDLAGAMATLDSARAVLPEWHGAVGWQVLFAASTGDFAGADSLLAALDATADSPLDRTHARESHFLLTSMRGRLREAERTLDSPGAELYMANPATVDGYRARLLLLRGDTASAVRLVRDTYAAHAGSADLDIAGLLTLLIEAGAGDAAADLLAAWDTIVPVGERGFGGRIDTEILTARAASLRGDHARALATLEAARRRYPPRTTQIRYATGRTHEAMGRPRLAIAEYEASLAYPDPLRIADIVQVPYTLRRLAELYDAAGDTQKALAYYARFVDLWKDADPELQPQVVAARRRIERFLPDR